MSTARYELNILVHFRLLFVFKWLILWNSMLIVVVPSYIDEGRPTDLPTNHTTALEFDKIRNSDNYSDVSDSFYQAEGLGVGGGAGEEKRFTARSYQAIGFVAPQIGRSKHYK